MPSPSLPCDHFNLFALLGQIPLSHLIYGGTPRRKPDFAKAQGNCSATATTLLGPCSPQAASNLIILTQAVKQEDQGPCTYDVRIDGY